MGTWGACSPQADVQRLKTSGASTRKTLLSMVAVQVESQSWYSQRLREYLDKAPALLEKGPTVSLHEATLAGMAVTVESGPDLLQICRQILPLKAVLRDGSCDGITEALQKAIGTMQEICKEKGKSMTKAQVEQLSQLFAEASNVFPLDASLHETSGELAKWLLVCGQREIVIDIKAAFEKMLELPVENMEGLQESLNDLDPRIQGVSVGQKLLAEECGEVLQKMCQFLMQVLDAYCTASGEMAPVVPTAAEAWVVLAGWRGDGDEQKLAKKIRAEVSVCEALQELDATMGDGDEEGFIHKAQTLQRRLAASKALGDLKSCKMQLQCFKPLSECICKAEAALAKCCGLASKQNKQRVMDLCQELTTVAGGMPDGTDWLHDYKGTDWPSLLDHAAITLLTQDAPGALALHNRLQQAGFFFLGGVGGWVLKLQLFLGGGGCCGSKKENVLVAS